MITPKDSSTGFSGQGKTIRELLAMEVPSVANPRIIFRCTAAERR
jgi:hypothetical protein